MTNPKSIGKIVTIAFKAVAVAMAVAVVVLNALKGVTVETSITLLGIGLFGLAVTSLDKEDS